MTSIHFDLVNGTLYSSPLKGSVSTMSPQSPFDESLKMWCSLNILSYIKVFTKMGTQLYRKGKVIHSVHDAGGILASFPGSP